MTTIKNRVSPDFAYYSVITLISLILITASQHIGMMNQGDFRRAIGFMLTLPTDPIPGTYIAPTGFHWLFRPDFTGSRLGNNTSSFIFGLAGIIQKRFSDTFSLFSLALVAKVFLLIFCHLIAKRAAELMGLRVVGRIILFVLLAMTMFYAHNIALLNSFYQEYAFFLFLPILLWAALMEEDSKAKIFFCSLAALFCGGAKTQYFYIPLLFLIVVLAIGVIERRKVDKRLVFWMLAVQILCFIPLKKNDASRLNYYHSTFLGSYMQLNHEQLRQLGLDEEAMKCIGVDAWGNRLSGPGGTMVTSGEPTCIDKKKISVRDVLNPYIKFPETAVRIWHWAMPEHFTVDYYHVSKSIPYIVPTHGKSYQSGEYLLDATRIRDKVISPVFGFIIALGIFLPLIKARSMKNPFRIASIFLAGAIVSQIIISLLGEGVRDLSKHLWAAQYCLDLLLIVCIAQLALIFKFKRPT